MNNGCPTVKWISLFLPLVVIVSFNFIPQKTGAQGQSVKSHKISPDLLELAHGAATKRVPVIIQFNGRPGASFDSAVSQTGGFVKTDLLNFNSRVMGTPGPAIEAFGGAPAVGFVFPDPTTIFFMHVLLTAPDQPL